MSNDERIEISAKDFGECISYINSQTEFYEEKLRIHKNIGELLLQLIEMATKDVVVKYDILNRPIEDLGLSVRTKHALQGEYIYHIGDLVKRSEYDLIRTPNLGKKSCLKIKNALAQHGLSLGMII